MENKEFNCPDCGRRLKSKTEKQFIFNLFEHRRTGARHGLTLSNDDPYNKRILQDYEDAKRSLEARLEVER